MAGAPAGAVVLSPARTACPPELGLVPDEPEQPVVAGVLGRAGAAASRDDARRRRVHGLDERPERLRRRHVHAEAPGIRPAVGSDVVAHDRALARVRAAARREADRRQRGLVVTTREKTSYL